MWQSPIKMGAGLEGCTSCELYKKHLMNNDLERDGASAKSVAREPRGLYEAGVFQKYCINLHSTVLHCQVELGQPTA